MDKAQITRSIERGTSIANNGKILRFINLMDMPPLVVSTPIMIFRAKR